MAAALRKYQLRALKTLRERLTMERFSTMDAEETARIREATRIWRQTWILPVLDALIEGAPADNPAYKL